MSYITTYKCDRCGKETKDKSQFHVSGEITIMKGTLCIYTTTNRPDLCKSCLGDLQTTLTSTMRAFWKVKQWLL